MIKFKIKIMNNIVRLQLKIKDIKNKQNKITKTNKKNREIIAIVLTNNLINIDKNSRPNIKTKEI